MTVTQMIKSGLETLEHDHVFSRFTKVLIKLYCIKDIVWSVYLTTYSCSFCTVEVNIITNIL